MLHSPTMFNIFLVNPLLYYYPLYCIHLQVVCALSSCKPVVSPDWVKEAIRCRNSSLPLPSPSSYQPPVVDVNLTGRGADGQTVTFAPDYSRTVLFKDRVFYFLSDKQVMEFGIFHLSTMYLHFPRMRSAQPTWCFRAE